MDVIHMSCKIRLVADEMLPETSLPDGGFTRAQARKVTLAVRTTRLKIRAGEQGFDAFPAGGEIVVMIRQCPDAVQVIWQ